MLREAKVQLTNTSLLPALWQSIQEHVLPLHITRQPRAPLFLNLDGSAAQDWPDNQCTCQWGARHANKVLDPVLLTEPPCLV